MRTVTGVAPVGVSSPVGVISMPVGSKSISEGKRSISVDVTSAPVGRFEPDEARDKLLSLANG